MLTRDSVGVLYAPRPLDDLPGQGDTITVNGLALTLDSGGAGEAGSLIGYTLTNLGALDGTVVAAHLREGTAIEVTGLDEGATYPLTTQTRPGNTLFMHTVLGGLAEGESVATVTLPGLVLVGEDGQTVEIVDDFRFRLDASDSAR